MNKEKKYYPKKSKQEELESIERKFHRLMKHRASKISEINDLEMPKITKDLLNIKKESWLPVPGMCRGFPYKLSKENHKYVLYTSNWSRIVGVSGQTHRITANRIKLIDEDLYKKNKKNGLKIINLQI